MGCLQSLLKAQDASSWLLPASQIGPRKLLVMLMTFAMDSRPKIRKKALESLTDILQTHPRGPSLDHPAADMGASMALNSLQQAAEAAGRIKKGKHGQLEGHDPNLMHALQFTKAMAKASNGWPSQNIEPLCEALLNISRSNSEYLVMAAFEVFEVILEGMGDEISSSKIPRLLGAIEELKPSKADSQLLAPWIAVLSRGYEVYAKVEAEETFMKLPELFDFICPFLTSASHNIRVSASECLISFLANCISTSVIEEPTPYDEKVLEQLASRAKDLLSIKYQGAWMEVFNVLSAFFDAFSYRSEPFLRGVVATIGELRGNEAFQGKKDVETVLGHAITNAGPEAVLDILPLNLAQPKVGKPGRAWLLPLLRDNVSNASLQHFKSEFVPLSQIMYQRVIDQGTAEKTTEIKIYETVVQQVWSILPGYCILPLELRQAMDQQFAEMLSNLLYSQPELRRDICRALQNIVESYESFQNSKAEEHRARISWKEAGESLDHMRGFASNLLAVLFNVYGQTLPQNRGYILQCMNAYLGVIPEKDLVDTYDRVRTMLAEKLIVTEAQPTAASQKKGKDTLPPESHTLLDILVTVSAHLPTTALQSLFTLAAQIIKKTEGRRQDPHLVKKAYRLVPRLASTASGLSALKARHSDLQTLIFEATDDTPPAARYPRLLTLDALIITLPVTDLHFIPTILSEVVLACKSTSDKARQTAFQILLNVVKVITTAPEGTLIQNKKVPHMPADASDARTSLEEVFVMVSAGLAGSAPHVVAASIIALGRLLFEFHNRLDAALLSDLVDTVSMFLESNSREIVRSVLGFVKVVIVILPVKVLRPKMGSLISKTVPWCKEHKGRLRAKVKGILERAVRKFGVAEVEHWVLMNESMGEDGRKLVRSIRKEKDRRKKKGKKSGAEGEGSEGEEDMEFDNEYDKAVYGSDDDEGLSDLGSDEDEDMEGVALSKPTRRSKTIGDNGKKTNQFIREDVEDDAEPLDLLAPNAIANVSSKKTVQFGKNAKLGHRPKATVNEDGKLVFGGPRNGKTEDRMDVENGGGTNVGGVDAYVDAVSGPNALKRGQRGSFKVNSANQRSSQEDLDENEIRDVAMKIMGGGKSSRNLSTTKAGGKKSKLPQRRGLGVEKQRHSNNGHGGNRRRGGVMKASGRKGRF